MNFDIVKPTNNKMIFIIILLLLLSQVSSFGKRRVHKSKNDEDTCEKTVLHELFINSNATFIDPYCKCDSVVGIVQKIPYIQESLENSLTVHFSSACVKCGMCLAIANQINDTLLEIHESMDTWLNDTEAIILLRNICNFAFKQIFHNMWDHWNTNVAIILQQSQIFIYIFFIVFVSCPLFGNGFYILRNILHIYFICIYCMNIYCIYSYSLREINGKRFICDYVPGSTLVTSSGDGLWETHLRDNCNEYLNEINPLELYQYWQQWCQDDHQNPNLVTILCRNEAGKLRDCRSMDEMIKFELPSKHYQANVKLKVEFGC